jgi:hypothetical protein
MKEIYMKPTLTLLAALLLAPLAALHAARATASTREERAQRSFPKEVERINVHDLKLPVWNGKLALANMPWDALIARARQDQGLAKAFVDWRADASYCAGQEIQYRPSSISDLPKERLSPQVLSVLRKYSGRPEGEIYALGLDSVDVWGKFHYRLIPFALVVRNSGDKVALDYLVRQLKEIATWFPLQARGWSANLPPGSKEHDGPWLAESGLIHIALTLDILGDRLPPPLRTDLLALCQREIDWIMQCWGEKRTWYMKQNAYSSNQWGVPTAGLLMACLAVGEERNRAAYDFAALNLAKHFASQGESGSFAEGYSYSHMTMESVLMAVWAMDRTGDKRLSSLPFLANYATWVHQMTMPGGTLVNYADSGYSRLHPQPSRSLLLAVGISKKPEDLWGIERLYAAFDEKDPFTHLYRTEVASLPRERRPLALSAFFANSQLAVWRSNWSLDRAMGVWAKGGTLNDYPHNHTDQGQVVVMNGAEPILLETGGLMKQGFGYASPEYILKAVSCAAHNVIQTATGLTKRRSVVRAPVEVKRMDAGGGELRIDVSEAQPEVKSWIRDVEWSAEGRVTINDNAVLFKPKNTDDEWFRWHIGATKPPDIRGSGNTWQVAWNRNQLTLKANRPIQVEAIEWPNALLGKSHAVIIKSVNAGADLQLTSVVTFPLKPTVK